MNSNYKMLLFIDESGTYNPDKLSPKGNFLVGGILISEHNYKILYKKVLDIQKLYKIYNSPIEIKWRLISNIIREYINGNDVSEKQHAKLQDLALFRKDKSDYYIETVDSVVSYLLKLLEVVESIEDIFYIFSYANPFYLKKYLNININIKSQFDLHGIMIQNIFERIELHMQNHVRTSTDSVIIIADQLEHKSKDNEYMKKYEHAIKNDFYIKNYKHFIDLFFTIDSRNNIGIHLIDILLGITRGKILGHPFASEYFSKYIYHKIMQAPNGQKVGYGITLPYIKRKHKPFRQYLEDFFEQKNAITLDWKNINV